MILWESFLSLFRKYKKYDCNSGCCSKPTNHESDSGRYTLTIESIPTKPGCWNYTKGTVKDGTTIVAVVDRNYSAFPFLFVEGHPDGHDYLVCGEDYQGQTIIQLDTGARKDYLPEEAKKGWGFCWASYEVSPSKKYLLVDGCYWGAPYELLFVDFSSPMELPYKVISIYCEDGEFDRWESDHEIVMQKEEKIIVSTGELSDTLFSSLGKDPEEVCKIIRDMTKRGEIIEKKIYKTWYPFKEPAEEEEE